MTAGLGFIRRVKKNICFSHNNEFETSRRRDDLTFYFPMRPELFSTIGQYRSTLL